ncbi:hypothetical protein BDQ12DRAFT_722792 [Crucibulum laeve]|uniref:F-box domain-containing protein n=1 Tax=Crucibulum laeve TaxID=68775 RepID=A0A5C3M2B7_9AGAR|nr:hypothetical protein BDQ12DRAFT_722792 [Crucibulum laeve]
MIAHPCLFHFSTDHIHLAVDIPALSNHPRVGICYASLYMDLSLEAYRTIVKSVGNRADIATLCRVSRSFRYVAERALYNTLYMRNVYETISLCDTLAKQPRLATLVDALTIFLSDAEPSSDSEEEEEEPERVDPPDSYWSSIAQALEQTSNLRYLNIHVNNGSNTSSAWILDSYWDHHLVTFLNKQEDLNDLYIIDYNDFANPDTPTADIPIPPSSSLDTRSLPNLSTLECTFSEAATAIVPRRPITRLKTCFSRTEIVEKRLEMSNLFSKVKQSTRALLSLDIADSSYTEAFSMELLSSIVNTKATSSDLRYLGTLVLPIAGRERLQFYGLLMRLPQIRCIEVEVSEWIPAPSSPPAFRALASELRLYCPSITRIVFVNDFDRTVVSAVDGVCRIDADISPDILWRES